MFVNSLQNQIKWFLANTWTGTLTDGSAICCCQVKNQENWHWLHCWEGNYSCDKICKPMHFAYICGMDFSSLASYWQIKALLMLEPSVVTPQNQYFPANSERMSVHCLESGCIGKFTHLGPRDFPRVGILHPSALKIALGQSLGPRGAKSPPLGNLLGLGECIFQYIPPLGSVRTQY